VARRGGWMAAFEEAAHVLAQSFVRRRAGLREKAEGGGWADGDVVCPAMPREREGGIYGDFSFLRGFIFLIVLYVVVPRSSFF